MKIREAAKAMFGGFAVYVGMAACSAAGTAPFGAGGSSAGSHGVAAGTSGHSVSGAGGLGGEGAEASGTGGFDAGEIWDALTDPVPSAAADPVSGSRLKAKYRVADDGSKEYLSDVWYDSQRNEDCWFVAAGDGVLRCLPSLVTFTFYYADQACSQPVVEVAAAASCSSPMVPKYVNTYDVDPVTCASRTHIRKVIAQVNSANLFSGSAAMCSKVGPNPGSTYYSTGPELAATSFVAATVMHD